MKKVLLLFVSLVFASTSLVSCKDDDNGGGSTIHGKWIGHKTTVYLNGNVFEEEDWEHLCSSKKDYAEFRSNGTFTSVTHEEDCSAETETGDYTYSGNYITLTVDGEEVSFKVASLSSSRLVLEMEEFEEMGMTIKVNLEFRK